MKARSDYLSGKCSHREYYSQFVTEGLKKQVEDKIGKENIIKSEEESFNDISLYVWGGIMPPSCAREKMRSLGDYLTLSGCVCIAKEAARQIKESAS